MSAPLIIRWGFMPPEARAALRPILLDYLWLVPGWCRLLIVDWGQNENLDAAAMAKSMPEYLWGNVTIFPRWLHGYAGDRQLDVVHELLELQLAPLRTELRGTIDRLVEEGEAPKFRATLIEGARRAGEQSVQNLAYSILQIPRVSLPQVPFVEEEDETPNITYAQVS